MMMTGGLCACTSGRNSNPCRMAPSDGNATSLIMCHLAAIICCLILLHRVTACGGFGMRFKPLRVGIDRVPLNDRCQAIWTAALTVRNWPHAVGRCEGRSVSYRAHFARRRNTTYLARTAGTLLDADVIGALPVDFA